MRFAALLILLFAANSVFADTIRLPDGAHFPRISPIDVNGPIARTVGTFDAFDTSLGTLTSVSFVLLGGGCCASFYADLGLTVVDPGNYMGRLRIVDTFGVQDSAELWTGLTYLGGFGGAGYWTVGDDGSVYHQNDGTPTGGTPFVLNFGDGNGTYYQSVTFTDNLEFFTTPGTIFEFARYSEFDVQFPDGSIHSIPATTSSGGLSVGQWSDTSLNGVTYTYTPVPEPGTALLVGLGLAVIGVSRSRGTA